MVGAIEFGGSFIALGVNRVIRRQYKEEEIKITQDYLWFETEVAKIFFGSQP